MPCLLGHGHMTMEHTVDLKKLGKADLSDYSCRGACSMPATDGFVQTVPKQRGSRVRKGVRQSAASSTGAAGLNCCRAYFIACCRTSSESTESGLCAVCNDTRPGWNIHNEEVRV
jgi:hypothetical protein